MNQKRLKKLVADSAAFIKNSQMHEIAESVYTIREVVEEIRDQATRQRLRVLPYELKMMEPTTESIRFVTEFSKKTGDYASLSATDMKVLALTYQLEVEVNGNEHIKTEPAMKKSVVVGPKPPSTTVKVENVAGFFMPKANNVEELAEEIEALNVGDSRETLKTTGTPDLQEDEYVDIPSDEEEEDEGNAEHDDDEDEDDGGWITPGNIQSVKHQMNGIVETVQVDVACLTTDFAMQNVLMQMGLQLVSLDGKLIHETRTYILRCHACFKTTSNVSKVFCPKCGNKTLKKVAVTLNEDGTLQIHISTRKRLSARGKKFSLPMPKGGKHANNPILVEDQREAQQRASKLGRTKTNALDPDYLAGNSPFAVNDVYSRAAQLGRTGRTGNYWSRRNPNEVRKKKR